MIRIIYLAIFLSAISGCTSKYKLFEDKDKVTQTGEKKTQGLLQMFFPKKQKEVLKEESLNFKYSSKIISGDELHIDIFNKSKVARFEDIQSIDPSGVSLKQSKANGDYVVDEDGTIYLPLLGEINIAGLDQKEASEMISQRYTRYLNRPYAKVKLKSTRVYVLGEIAKPGMLPITPSGISIFEVLAKVGDFTDYAQKDDIRIISGELGKQTIRSIDLTSIKKINHTNLMIKPNSIVYVSPRAMKEVKVSISDVSPIISLISSTLGAYLSIDYISKGRD